MIADPVTQADEDRAMRKRFATAQAQLALSGYVLRKIDDGSYVVSRWGMFRELLDLDACERFAGLVGAK